MTLKVVTYNVRHCRGMDRVVDIHRVADTLRMLDADIICLQELDWCNPRSGWSRQANQIGRLLNMHVCYYNSFSAGVFLGFGNAILTREVQYSTWNRRLPSRGEPRCLMQAEIRPNGRRVRIYCTHWGLDSKQRILQAEESARLIALPLRDDSSSFAASPMHPATVIYCGDFNSGADSAEIHYLAGHAGLTPLGSDNHFYTYPSDHPSVRIDHILAGGENSVESIEPILSLASDHLALCAVVRLAP